MAMSSEPGAELRSRERPRIVRMRRRRTITWIVVGVLLLGGILWMRSTGKKAKAAMEAMQWESRTVELTDVEVVVTETGSVEPLTQVVVKSEVAAAVSDILVEEGDTVTAGQIVALLDASRVQQDVDMNVAQVDAAMADVRRAQLSRTQSEGTSSAQLASADASLASARAALDMTTTGNRPEEVEQAKEQLEQSRATLASENARMEELLAGARPGEVEEQRMAVRQAEAQLASAEVQLAKAESGNRAEEIEEARAQLVQAQASTRAAEAAFAKIRAGNRPQEIRQAEAECDRATAQLADAEAAFNRQVELHAAGYRSEQEVDTARATYLSARAAASSAQQALEMAREGARSEDVAAAEADLTRAQASERATRERLALVEAGTRAEDVEDARQSVMSARAALQSRQAALDLLVEGTREEQIRQQQAAVARAESAVRAAEAAHRMSEVGSRIEEIQRAEAALRDAEAGVRSAEAQGLTPKISSEDIVRARAQLEVARTQLLRTQEDLTDCTVVAPVGGVVLKRHIEPGELASSGTTGFTDGTPLITVGDTSKLIVKLEVHEVDVVHLSTGMTAQLRFDAFQGEVFPGSVYEIAPQSTAASAAQLSGQETPSTASTFTVKVALDEPDERIRSGMSARVTVVCETAEGVPAVPMAALKTEDEKTFVLVPPADAKPIPSPMPGMPEMPLAPGQEPDKREVELGLRGSTMVEIRSGLEAGETILLKRPDTKFDIMKQGG